MTQQLSEPRRHRRSGGTSGLARVLNAYTLAFATMLIPAGRLADRTRSKTMITKCC